MDAGEWRVYEAAGLRLRVYTHPCVYEPGDDSLLAVEAMARAPWRGVARAVDLGSGTGILGLAAATLYGASVVAVDSNPWAARASALTLGSAGSAIQCDWGSCLLPGFDLAVSNPPYLPVEDRLPGECGTELARAWSGGARAAREACEAAARLAPRVVLVYSSLTGWSPEECLERRGFRVVARLAKRFFMETVFAVAAEAAGRWTGSA